MKTCYICGNSLPLEDFYLSSKAKDGRQNRCKECHRLTQLNYYHNNKQKASDYKLEKGCVDCGYNKNPYALDFDHLDGKSYTISQHLHRKSWASLLKEISKCEVRCANCHRIKTAERLHDV